MTAKKGYYRRRGQISPTFIEEEVPNGRYYVAFDKPTRMFLETEYPSLHRAFTSNGVNDIIIHWCNGCQDYSKFTHVKSSKGRIFRCGKGCNDRINTTAGTVMHRSQTPIKKWYKAYLMLKRNRLILTSEMMLYLDVGYPRATHLRQTILRNMKIFDRWFEPLQMVYDYSQYMTSPSPSPEEWEQASQESQARILAKHGTI